jgi:hypothetical protein
VGVIDGMGGRSKRSSISSDIVQCVADTLAGLPDVLVDEIIQFAERRKLLLLGGSGLPLLEVLDGNEWRRPRPDEPVLCDTITRLWSVDDRFALLHNGAVLALAANAGSIVTLYDAHTGAIIFSDTTCTQNSTPHRRWHWFVLNGCLHALQTGSGVLAKLDKLQGCYRWTELHAGPAPPFLIYFLGHRPIVSAVDGRHGLLYVAQTSTEVHRYNCATAQLTTFAGTRHSRTWFTLVLLNERLYAIGNDGKNHKHVEWLDVSPTAHRLEQEQRTLAVWQDGPDLLMERWGPAACAVDDTIVVVGGRSAMGRCWSIVECLDTLKSPPAWTLLAPCSFGREDAQLVLL